MHWSLFTCVAALICSLQLVFRYITPPSTRRFPKIGHGKHYTIKYNVCVRADTVNIVCDVFILYASSLFQMKPPFCRSRQSVVAAPSRRVPPASRNFCTSCFSGFGYDVWSQGERSWRAGVLVLASTGPAAPLPLSLLLLIWHGESTFCSIVLCMN